MDIEIRSLTKRYGAQVALSELTLAIPCGQRVALVGPNGSGKSTLLRAIMGLIACEGTVRLDGASPFDERERVATRIAYVPQIAPQLGAPVREVVQAVTRLRGLDPNRVGEISARLGLDLAAVAKKPFRQLSGGMKQKLLVALAFASGASLLILDEPTASLDAGARDRFVALLDEATTSGATVLLCSHRPDDVQRLADRVIELGEGRIVRDFTAMTGAAERAPRRAAQGNES
jgi:ABC-2 type transport system ATP-binding protein